MCTFTVIMASADLGDFDLSKAVAPRPLPEQYQNQTWAKKFTFVSHGYSIVFIAGNDMQALRIGETKLIKRDMG